MSVSNFPDFIQVTFGSAWNSPFSEDDTLILEKSFDNGNNVIYSEDGTNNGGPENRLKIYIEVLVSSSVFRLFGVGNYSSWNTIGGLLNALDVGSDYEFKELWSNNPKIQMVGSNFVDKTYGSRTAIQSIFKNMEVYPPEGGGGGGGGGDAVTEMFFKCKQDQPFKNGYAVTNVNITGNYGSKSPEREVNTFDSGLITNRLSGRFDDRGYYGR